MLTSHPGCVPTFHPVPLGSSAGQNKAEFMLFLLLHILKQIPNARELNIHHIIHVSKIYKMSIYCKCVKFPLTSLMLFMLMMMMKMMPNAVLPSSGHSLEQRPGNLSGLTYWLYCISAGKMNRTCLFGFFFYIINAY